MLPSELGEGWRVFFEGRNTVRLLLGLWVSVWIAMVATGLSILLGFPLGLVMTSRHRIVRAICQVYLGIIRVLPPLVLLFVFYYDLTFAMGINLSGQAAAVIVFTLWGVAEMGDLVRGAVTSIPQFQYESAAALGLTSTQIHTRVVLPLSIRRLLPQAVNLVTRMIKTTSLIVLIGVVEVLKVGQQIINANRFTYPDASLWVYGAVFFLYFLACYPIARLARHLEKKWEVS